MISLPSAEDVEQYARRPDPPGRGMPRVLDAEPVCRVHVPDTGSVSYWSRGDVDVHVLHARQHGYVNLYMEDLAAPASLAVTLRHRRQQRLLLQRGGVQTTAGGLLLLQRPTPRLVLPGSS